LIAVLATVAACSGEESDATCPGNGGTECAKHCGSDVVAELECVNGEWKCPSGYVHGYKDCPAGTCFGPPAQCCSPTGESAPQVCSPYAGGLPSGGTCPAGY